MGFQETRTWAFHHNVLSVPFQVNRNCSQQNRAINFLSKYPQPKQLCDWLLKLFSRQVNEQPTSKVSHLFLFFSQLETFVAEGPVFSSGHDLKELTEEQGPDYHTEVFQTCSEVSQDDSQHCKTKMIIIIELASWFTDKLSSMSSNHHGATENSVITGGSFIQTMIWFDL